MRADDDVSLLAEHNLPFAAALVLMALIALVQAFGLGGAEADLEVDAEAGHADVAGGLASLFGLGRVPLMIWLAALLLFFAGLGLGIQATARALLGAPLDRWLAAALALIAALPATGLMVRPLARILPRDETTAVTLESLVGRRAIITTGKARAGSPARARVQDRFGHPHHVMVEPHEATSVIDEGDTVLLVRREQETFYAMPLHDRLLAPII